MGSRQRQVAFLAFDLDLDLWPTTLTYNPNLANVKVNLHTKYQGRRSNSSAVRAVTDGRTLPSTWSPCFAVDKETITIIMNNLIVSDFFLFSFVKYGEKYWMFYESTGPQGNPSQLCEYIYMYQIQRLFLVNVHSRQLSTDLQWLLIRPVQTGLITFHWVCFFVSLFQTSNTKLFYHSSSWSVLHIVMQFGIEVCLDNT